MPQLHTLLHFHLTLIVLINSSSRRDLILEFSKLLSLHSRRGREPVVVSAVLSTALGRSSFSCEYGMGYFSAVVPGGVRHANVPWMIHISRSSADRHIELSMCLRVLIAQAQRHNACILCLTAAAGTELADAYSPDTVIASSPGKEVHDPWAFCLHAALLRQAFAHCGKFLTAASRRSLGRVSVPVWLIILSDQLLIVALVDLIASIIVQSSSRRAPLLLDPQRQNVRLAPTVHHDSLSRDH
ncbi:hypothetical protein Cgig2_032233 [Carnegiea gigantea]|uniref:Uncharacterized protein n=1 Tax=Carnegiea gigantea TaxID=171969 RepID=A0A9Q1JMK5_9CARY|nr:hypothetical protein Cgig2_032233 [Carnegiea gigantea]